MIVSARNFSHVKLRSDWAERAESLEAVEIELKPDDWSLLRLLFRDADWLLKPEGRISVTPPREIAAACQWDLWTLGAQRYHYREDRGTVHLVKKARRQEHASAPDAWSIAVISGGRNEKRLERLFASVARQGMTQVEVLVVGPQPNLTLPAFARHVPYAESPTDPRFPICAKKNLVAAEARFENLLIVHDRFRCADDWFHQTTKYRPDWDVMVVGMVFEGSREDRLADWCSYNLGSSDGLVRERVSGYDKVYPFNYRRHDMRQLPYALYSPFVAVNGGAFAVKRHVLREVPLNRRLHWAEIEDGDWTRQLHLRGKVVTLGQDCVVESLNDGRHSTARGSLIGRLATGATSGIYFSRFREGCFRMLQRGIDRLNRRSDFFTQRGHFARRAATLTAPQEKDVQAVDWVENDVIHLRKFAENRETLRDLLRELKSSVPRGKEVHFEMASTGFPYFRRSGHSRNCEGLCYEVSTYLGDDFECRFLLSTLQHNFVAAYRRTSEPQPAPLRRVRVLGEDAATGPGGAFLAALGVETAGATDDACDAVLYLRQAPPVTSAPHWREIYTKYGAVCSSPAASRVLDGTLLIEAKDYARVARGWTPDETEASRQAFETALIFAGIHPVRVG